jgi:hypothetical protein
MVEDGADDGVQRLSVDEAWRVVSDGFLRRREETEAAAQDLRARATTISDDPERKMSATARVGFTMFMFCFWSRGMEVET